MSCSLNLRGRLQVCHISRSYRGTFRKHRQEDTIFEHSSGLAMTRYLPEGSLYIYLKPQFLCHPGDASRSPGLEVSKVYNYGPTLYIFPYFKSCYLRILFLISLKLGAD